MSEEEDYIEEIVMDFCGENYGIRETYDPVGSELLTTKHIAKILSDWKGTIITDASIRDYKKRYWEKFYHVSVKKVNRDRTRNQIFYHVAAIPIFKELLSEGLERVMFEPNSIPYPKNSRRSTFSSSSDPIFEIMGKMLDVLKIYVSNKKSPKKTKQLEEKFMDLLEYSGEDKKENKK